MSFRKSQNKIVVKFSGDAGDGLLTTGDVFAAAAFKKNLFSSVWKNFSSDIRGGLSQSFVTISKYEILSPVSDFDVLFCLSSTSFESEFSLITKSKMVLIETSLDQNTDIHERIDSLRNSGVTVILIPVKNLVGKTAGEATFYSAVMLGILSHLFCISPDIINQIIFDRFKSKGSKITSGNKTAFKAGFSWSEQHCSPLFAFATSKETEFLPQRIFIEGNRAISYGAVAAGCTFFASYPITPATTIGNYLSTHMIDSGGFAYQAEDEIAALGAVIGASFSGSKAMTATSGPGLSLMQEFIGFASISELPVVIADIQRVGPSTGMPTKHGQDDLLAAAFGSHGDYQKIIVAPTNVSDCIYTTIHAFNLAERYQCPVIILSDSALASMKETIDKPDFSSVKIENRKILRSENRDEPYLRFKPTSSGIESIPVPGESPLTYRITGMEHEQDSTPVKTPAAREEQMRKRFEKLSLIEQENEMLLEWDLESTDVYDADFSLIAWGLTASIARESVKRLRAKGYKVAALYPQLLFPVCVNAIHKLLRFSANLYIPEANYTGHLANLIRMYTDAKPERINISRGEPFTPEEIEQRIMGLINKK